MNALLGTFSDFAGVFTHRHAWWLMAAQDIAMRYRRSVIGPFWISISLGAMILGIGLLYSRIFGWEASEYLIYLGAGFLAWNFLSALLNEGCAALVEAEGILRNTPMPTSALASRVVARNFIIMLHNLLVVAAIFLIFGHQPTTTTLWAIPGFLMIAAFGYFLTLVLAPICLRFRDIPQVVVNGMQVAFFLTPVIWSVEDARLPEIYLVLNPLYSFLEIVREPILGRLPEAKHWMVAGTSVGIAFVLAMVTSMVSRKKLFVWL